MTGEVKLSLHKTVKVHTNMSKAHREAWPRWIQQALVLVNARSPNSRKHPLIFAMGAKTHIEKINGFQRIPDLQ